MATNDKIPAAAKPAREKKAPVAVIIRLQDQMKRATLGGKLSAEDLDKIAALAGSLKVFVQS